MIELRNPDTVVSVVPSIGGRLAQIRVSGQDLLIDEMKDGPIYWGSYPMAPWAGRVGGGRFRFDDDDVQLPVNMPPHALHGTVFDRPWTVQEATSSSLAMSTDLHWPLGGTAHQTVTLGTQQVECTLTITAASRPIPTIIGWHPWFVRPAASSLHFETMYERGADHLPTGALVAPRDSERDDCFMQPRGPLLLHYPTLTVAVDSDCDHWVVYDQPTHALCVEPQSGPPNGYPLGRFTRLEPGHSLSRWMRISWSVAEYAGDLSIS
jgi:aldose 1-epimerase